MQHEFSQSKALGKRQRLGNYVAPPLTAAAFMFCAAPAAATVCSDLIHLSLPNTTITLAQSYAAGTVVSGTTRAPVGLCRIAATAKPGSQSNVHFEIWIPTDGSWNGKYQQIGNGGFAGSISLASIANAVSRGYATAGTDDGTSGPPSGAPTFVGNLDVLLDYGYRAVKATGDNSKAIVSALGRRRAVRISSDAPTAAGKRCRKPSVSPRISTASSRALRSTTKLASSGRRTCSTARRR